MIRGFYAAAAGMVAQLTRQEVVANNLANVNTPGFKRDVTPLIAGRELPTAGDFHGTLSVASRTGSHRWFIGTVGTGSLVDQSIPDLSQGPLRQTGNELDLALHGDAHFIVQGYAGETLYTRVGSFSRDGEGRLVSPEGFLLVGQEGPIVLPPGEVRVDEDGAVLLDGQVVDQIKLTAFAPDTPYRKVGFNVFVPEDPDEAPLEQVSVLVKQGYLEGSNVDPAESMTEMMSIMRAYEANQRILQMQDQALERAVNDLGRV